MSAYGHFENESTSRDIQIALIGSGKLMQRFGNGRPVDMLLPDVLLDPKREDYQEFYRSYKAPLRIMDNGAWESRTRKPSELLELAIEYGVRELIMPDIINSAYSTLELVEEFLSVSDQWRDDRVLNGLDALQFAAVVHGETQEAARAFVNAIADLNHPQVQTIAIGRAFARMIGNPTARYELALWIKRHYHGRFQVHLLGFNDEWPTELQHCRSWPGMVRSLDTVAPFTSGLAGFPIEAIGPLWTQQSTKIKRPHNFFARARISPSVGSLIAQNIATLDQWGRTRQWG